MMLLYTTTVRLGMLLKERRMVWSAKCLEPQSKTPFWTTVLSCTQPEVQIGGKPLLDALRTQRIGRKRFLCTQ